MGINQSKDEFELKIQTCEKVLQIHKFTIFQIKNAFFFLNKDDAISFEKIEKGFFHLGIVFNEEQNTKILKPFLKTFLIPKIEVTSQEDYHFRDLMGIFFILSKSSEEDKVAALYQLYDYSSNNSLSKNEIEHMFNRLLLKVDEFTKDLIKENELNISMKILQGNEKMMIESIITKVLNFLLEGDSSKDLSQKEFIKKMMKCKEMIKYDFLSASGIRSIFESLLS